jgi:type I restriction enzyme R subunit
MTASAFLEDIVSQLPALQLLCSMGYQYLTPSEVNALRDQRKGNVLLKPILGQQLRRQNQIEYKGHSVPFSDANIQTAINTLDVPLNDGLIKANESVHELLTLGTALPQTIDGDKRSFTLQYIDWNTPGNNVFHVTDEFEVERRGTHNHCRPDIVLFVNGIPLTVIECKRPDSQDAIHSAISQQIRNQGTGYIPQLFVFNQLLLAASQNQAKYATTGTPTKFWAIWRDELIESQPAETVQEAKADYSEGQPSLPQAPIPAQRLRDLVNQPLPEAIWKKFEQSHAGDVVVRAREFASAGLRLPSPQDELLYNIARPERLLELTERFVLFETSEGQLIKKICRYQQYFAILETLATVTNVRGDESRDGGVIWHTTGSGKSLTMVMLAKALAMEPTIRNPRVVVVTDRIDLDSQIFKTFKACGKQVSRAQSGEHLVNLISDGKTDIITTIIDKFESATLKHKLREESRDIFVLVDESHRSQSGLAHAAMRKVFPNACFIGFTGTPLLKAEKGKRKKKKKYQHLTKQTFGDYLHSYSMKKAVEDKAVTPILYEGRVSHLRPDKESIDKWFARITNDLTDDQRADLKRKFSQADELVNTRDRLYEIAFDICTHFCENFKNTPRKGQFAVSSKYQGLRYLKLINQIGQDFPERKVTARLVISAPDMREGHDELDEGKLTKEKKDSEASKQRKKAVQEFWDAMMAEYGSEARYLKNIVSDFKTKPEPEILIVVDKLLTGFDAPCNTVLYIDKILKGHSILQAIARVNRLFDGKDFGLVIDYRGIFGELNEAMQTYSELDGFDADEIEGTFTDVKKEIEKLPELHTNVWAVFSGVQNKNDLEAMQQHLRPEDVRQSFYESLNAFSKCLQLAMSNVEFHEDTPEAMVKRYLADMKYFRNLRAAVKNRYNEAVDYREYEDQLRNMVNKYVGASEVEQIIEPVNIFEVEDLETELESVDGTAAKADFISSRLKKTCTEKMDEDPVLFQSLSKMIEDAIAAYLAGRLSEKEYLDRMLTIWNELQSNDASNLPPILKGKGDALAYYRLILKTLEESDGTPTEIDLKSISANMAIAADNIIDSHKVRDWKRKDDVKNTMTNDLEDLLFDLKKNQLPDLASETIDAVLESVMRTAVKRER